MEEVLHHTPFCRDGTGQAGTTPAGVCHSLHRGTAPSSRSSSPPCPVAKGHYLHRTLTGSDGQTVSLPTAPSVGRNRQCPSTNNVSLTVPLRIVFFKAICVFSMFPSVCQPPIFKCSARTSAQRSLGASSSTRRNRHAPLVLLHPKKILVFPTGTTQRDFCPVCLF